MPISLYFDESGFTGPNLTDPDQPWFVYVGVALEDEYAHMIRSEAYSRFKLQASELKGSSLIRTIKGREAVSWILSRVCQHAGAVVANKQFSLAGKFFDYMIEPIIAEYNSIFYRIDFHKFVATHLAINSQVDNDHQELLGAFSKMMRRIDLAELDNVFRVWRGFSDLSPIGQLYTFSAGQRARIERELVVARSAVPMAHWLLELTTTALYCLLCHWGESDSSLDVYCDNSKSLLASEEFFSGFVGRTDKGYVKLSSAPPSSVVFNLNGPISLVDSRRSSGIQLADVLASALAFVLKRPDEPISKEWRSLCDLMIVNSIVPDRTLMDLRERTTFVNTQVLLELARSAGDRIALLERIPSIVQAATSIYPSYLQSIETELGVLGDS